MNLDFLAFWVIPASMPEIAVARLQADGYTEDRQSGRAFDRRLMPPSLAGLLLLIGPFPLFRFWWNPFKNFDEAMFGVFVCGVFGFGFLIWSTVRFRKAVAHSLHSAMPMHRYLRSDTPRRDQGYVEFIYVDHPSRTYFTRLVQSGHS